MTQTGDEDEPIPPKVGYNLDFLDDPNFNPFTTGSGIRLSPPSSPKSSLPPLKAAKTKKQRGTPAAAADPAPEVTNGVNGSTDAGGAGEPAEEVAEEQPKPPARKPAVRKPVRPVKRPLKKKVVTPPPPPQEDAQDAQPEPAAEPAAGAEQENGRSDSPPLAPPPSKGYNLDFLDNCDDPNFNPFATKTAVANSPTGSPQLPRKVANSPPLPARSAVKKSPAKAAPPPPEPEPEPEPEQEQEPEPEQEPTEEPEQEPERSSRLEDPSELSGRPDPLGGGDTSTMSARTALLDTGESVAAVEEGGGAMGRCRCSP